MGAPYGDYADRSFQMERAEPAGAGYSNSIAQNDISPFPRFSAISQLPSFRSSIWLSPRLGVSVSLWFFRSSLPVLQYGFPLCLRVSVVILVSGMYQEKLDLKRHLIHCFITFHFFGKAS